MAQAKRLGVSLSASWGPPSEANVSNIIVSGDPNKLGQVLRNLLSNALKFAGPNGFVKVLLEVVHSDEAGRSRKQTLGTSLSSSTTAVRIAVSDSGVGISKVSMRCVLSVNFGSRNLVLIKFFFVPYR